MRIIDTRSVTEDIMRQLKGFVPVGNPIHIHINYDYEYGEPYADFTVIQCFGEEDQPLHETEPATR